MFKGKMNEFGISVVPSTEATINSLLLGLLIPLISAILPARVALRQNLVESLDTARSKSKGMLIKVVLGEDNSSVIISGALFFLYGVLVYYCFPLALLNLNLSLLLGIFFVILLGMIAGLTLVAYNFERLVEIFIVRVLLFWETKAMRMLILKNLVAHKQKN